MSAIHRIAPVLNAVRIRQWPKNLLVFLPLIASHQITHLPLVGTGVIAFVTFSMAASAGYLFNDLRDVGADRAHPTRRSRPLAAGTIRASVAWGLIPVLLGSSLVVTWWSMSDLFLVALVSYITASAAYSLFLKPIPVLDVIVLTGLYCVRIVAGGFATDSFVSSWLLALSFFLFLSLALLKRYVELRELQASGEKKMTGRGYSLDDADVLRSAGVASGYLSVFLLSLYIGSDQARSLYESPSMLWLRGPVMIYWITRVWLLAHRGVIRDDPAVFASRDRVTYVVAGFTLAILFAAKVGTQVLP